MFTKQVFCQSTADFSAITTSGCPPFALKLIDNSSNPNGILTWNWTINGQNFSEQQNPASLINESGSYTICLTVTTSQGNDQECKTNFITVFDNPQAQLIADMQTGCVPLEVNFTNTSIPGSSSISDIIWDFGGSCGVVTSPANQPVGCTYENAGSFQVSMIVTDENGCADNIVLPDFIETSPLPVLDLTVPVYDDCEPPFVIDFGAAGPNSIDIEYFWDFGNGNTFQGVDPPSVSYTTSGPFTVSVNALNNLTGCEQTLILENAIEESNPIDFSFERRENCGTPELYFTDLSQGSADLIAWDFGDGNSSFLASPIHEFAGFGCYTITLTRTVGTCVKSLSREVCINELTPPVINTTINNQASCTLPHQSFFEVNAINEFDYSWDFGDGENSTEINPTHNYTAFGNYEVNLTVTDDLGCEIVMPVGIVEVQPISVSLGSAGQQGCAPLNVSFDPNISSFVPIVSYNWAIIENGGGTIFQSNEPNPSFSFSDLGCYDVTVNLVNADGCEINQTFSSVYCVGEAPSPAFSVDPIVGCASQIFSFTDESIGNVDYWQWDFQSDGTPDNFEQDPTFMYSDIGCFDIQLLVASFGCQASTSIGPICVEPPVAAFEIEVDCENPTTVVFTNLSEGADSVFWDFGVQNETTDTTSEFEPSFSYPILGTYEIELVTYNFNTACTDTSRLEINLEIPEANFQLPNNTLCRGEIILPINNSVGATSFLWSLPDGGMINDASVENPEIVFEESGIYSIQLEILNANNCSSIFLIENIQVSGPEPEFDFSVSGNCIPFLVTFNDLSTNQFSENFSWNWNIDELGMSSTNQSPVFELDTVGIFNVSLSVEDDLGCRDSIERSIGLNEGSPVAFFSGDLFGCEGIINNFQNASLGSDLIFSWDFGDGQFSSLENPAHEFSNGDYNVCLTIDDANCIDTHCELVQIQEIIADFLVDESYSSCAPAPVDFINLSQNAQDFYWNYGDGTGDIQIDMGSHIYNLQGVYDVELIAVGANIACQDTTTILEAINMTGPIASFNYSVDDFCVPSQLEIQIDGARNYDYLIFFGDGNSYEINDVSGTDTTYIFTAPTQDGYIPTVLVQESVGCEIALIGQDTLRFSELNVDFHSENPIICFDGEEIFFESDIVSSDPEYLIEWTFESGLPTNSQAINESVAYSGPGIFDVELLVSNANCSNSVLKEEYIQVFEEAQLDVEDYEICFGDTLEIPVMGNTDYFRWSPADIKITNEDSVFTSIASENIEISVSGAVGPCPEVTSFSNVIVYQLPTIEMENFHVYFPGEEVIIGPEAIDSLNYYWEPSEVLSCTFCPNPTIQLDSIGDFRIEVTDPYTGCLNEDIVKVRQYTQCPDFTLGLPNAFSPNGDGLNDEFKVAASLLDEIEFIRIFDRWGNFLWQSSDINLGWDGNYKGKKMGAGVYVYTVQARCPLDGRPFQKHGDITLLR